MALYGIVVGIKRIHGTLNFCRNDVGQKSQTPHVDTQNGSALLAHIAGSTQQGAVATQRHHKVSRKVAALKQFHLVVLQFVLGNKKVVKTPFYTYICPPTGEIFHDFVDVCRLLGLVYIAE